MSVRKDASRRNIAAIAREAAPKAIQKLADLLDHDDPKVVLDAAKHVLDRAVGKPVSMTADVTDRLDEFTDDQLDAAIADLEHRIQSANKAEAEAGVPQSTH